MFPISIRMQFVTLLFVFVVPLACGQDRKISSFENPGCTDCTNETLIWVKAVGPHDVLHQIWDFTRGLPTVIFCVASINSTISILWDNKRPKQFVLSEPPRYSFAAVIDKLYEFNDLEDSGQMTPNSKHRWYSLKDVNWQRKDTVLTDSEVMVKVVGQFGDGGSLGVKLDLLPFKDFAPELPHLIHTVNSTLVDVSLDNLKPYRDYNSSRYALHFILVSTDSSNKKMRYTMRKSLDDEHTPGVFEIVEIETPGNPNADGGFMQFRPVCYTQPERSVTSSSITHVSNFNRTIIPSSTTLDKFYADFNRQNLLVQDAFISFGETGDGFYKQHNYTAWSFTIGYGAPPIETFSLFVIVIICIGLGVPVLLALSGIVYVVVRRYKQRNAPQMFTDDE